MTTLVLDVEHPPTVSPAQIVGLWRRQRDRLVHQLQGLAPAQWSAGSRCRSWSVADVVAHLGDGAARMLPCLDPATASGADTFRDIDPRTTPADWIRGTERTPARLIEDYQRRTDDVLAAVAALGGAAADLDVWAPYGRRIPWQLFALHGFFDHWVHERDVLLPLGLRHQPTPAETKVAAAYAVLVAAVVATMRRPLALHLHLSGSGGGCFTADGLRGRVEVGETEGCRQGPDARGDAVLIADALTGRTRSLAEVVDGRPELTGPLGALGDWFRAGP